MPELQDRLSYLHLSAYLIRSIAYVVRVNAYGIRGTGRASTAVGKHMENERVSDIELPPSIALAWGLRDRPSKGPKRALTLDAIVAAGVEVASSDGLAAVSMARVASEVGASTMSLYRYVASKEELLGMMVDAAYGRPPELDPRASGWRDGLTRFAEAERAAL